MCMVRHICSVLYNVLDLTYPFTIYHSCVADIKFKCPASSLLYDLYRPTDQNSLFYSFLQYQHSDFFSTLSLRGESTVMSLRLCFMIRSPNISKFKRCKSCDLAWYAIELKKFQFLRIICDSWLCLDFPLHESGQALLLKASNLRRSWNKLLASKLDGLISSNRSHDNISIKLFSTF